MAKKQRGKTTASSPKKCTEKPTEQFSFMLESSDDEAPEEVTFEDSKVQALRSMNNALETIRRERELQKEKRRKRQELFQEQKKRKLLPADVLDEIDTASSNTHTKVGDEDGEKRPQEVKKKRKKNGIHVNTRNFTGSYKVTTGEDQTAASSFQLQAAQDFITSRLYGPGVCRSTSNQLFSIQNKKGQNKNAAVQFVKKDWASAHKAKAEKLKKRWIHKQKLTSC
ncbi:nucleolar protein 7 [Gouania willdenowi]|nr:nucleolar protein 7 [Gouania willdenowi]